jgi:hypothetical protein
MKKEGRKEEGRKEGRKEGTITLQWFFKYE